MAIKTLQIFKSGTHPAMDGRDYTFTAADLAATAAAYTPAAHEAPITIGHPATDLPAYGWVASLAVVDGALEATPAQVDPAFAELVASGAYKKISAKFYHPTQKSNPVPGTYYLRHVGFLGAQPPGVKGLRDPSFADLSDDNECITLELAFSEPLPSQPPVPASPVNTPKESTVNEEEAAQLRAENEALKKRIESAEAQALANAAAAVNAENTAFAEKLASEGRLISAEQPVVVAMLNAASPPPGSAGIEFAEGNKKMPLADAMRGFLAALPKRVSMDEQASRERVAAAAGGADDDGVAYAEGTEPERIKQDKAIRAYMVAHKTDYVSAAHAVMTK